MRILYSPCPCSVCADFDVFAVNAAQSEEVDGTAQDAGEDEEESMIDERWAALKELKRD